MPEQEIKLFDQVYWLAKQGNKTLLKKMHDAGFCLDVLDTSAIYTPAMKLAREGDKEAVALLVNLGVNIEKVAKGFAIGGDDNEVQLYHSHYGVCANEIATGFAMGKHHAKAQAYITYHDAEPTSVAEGYAYINNQKRIKKYIGLYKTKIDTYRVGMASASTGYHNEANYFYNARDEKSYLIVIGHAIANNQDEIARYSSDPNVNQTHIGYGHAIAGRFKKAEKYRTAENATEIAKGFAASGHNTYVEEYRTKYNANATEIAKMYALMEHIPEVVTYCTKYGVALNEILPYLAGAFNNEKIALRHLAFIDDENFRNKLMTELQNAKIKPEDENDNKLKPLLSYDISKLATQAKKINHLMRTENLGYNEAVAWEKAEIQIIFSHLDQVLIDDLIPIVGSYLLPLSDQESFHILEKTKASQPTPTQPAQNTAPRGRHDLFTQKNKLRSTHTTTPTPKPPTEKPLKKPRVLPPIQTNGTVFQKSSSQKKIPTGKTTALPEVEKKPRWK